MSVSTARPAGEHRGDGDTQTDDRDAGDRGDPATRSPIPGRADRLVLDVPVRVIVVELAGLLPAVAGVTVPRIGLIRHRPHPSRRRRGG